MRKLAFAAAAAFAFAGVASANTNLDWDQRLGGPPYNDGLASEFNTVVSDAETADDFFVLKSKIKHLTFWMIADRTAQYTYGFNIYTDGAPGPGGLHANQLGGGTVTNLGGFAGNFDLYRVEFDVNINVNVGDRYWVSPFGQGNGAGRVFWATNTSEVGNGQEGYFRSGFFGIPNWTPVSGVIGAPWEFAFQVWTVPAPGALALLGVAGLVARRRRRA